MAAGKLATGCVHQARQLGTHRPIAQECRAALHVGSCLWQILQQPYAITYTADAEENVQRLAALI